MATTKEYKDRLFSFIFGREENKEWTLSLYNAVNESHYTDPSKIKITTIKEVLYMGMHNDVSFILANELSLYEQQSTFNPNMPVRQFLYAAKLIEQYLEPTKRKLYWKSLQKIPAPKLVVFYNGTEEHPDETILKLSDAYLGGVKGDIEVAVRMLNSMSAKTKNYLMRVSHYRSMLGLSIGFEPIRNKCHVKRLSTKHWQKFQIVFN